MNVLRREHSASRATLAGAVLGVFAMTFSSALGCETKGDPPEVVTDLVKRTVPEGANSVTPPTLQRRDFRYSSTWQFQLDSGKLEYRAWLRAQLQPEFKLVDEDRTYLSFTKRTAGDAFALRVEEVELGPSVLVRITFDAQAD